MTTDRIDHALLDTTSRHFLGLALGLILALAGASASADEALDEVSAFDIAPQPLADALLEFSQQANIQIVMVSATVKDIEAGGIVGERTNREALELLLDDQELHYTQHDDRTVSIQTDAVIEDSASGKYWPASSSALLAQAQRSAPQKQETRNSQVSTDSDEFDRSSLLDEIIVTGTHIRGIAPESSPTRTFDREDIQISGAATAQDFIQTLPQNFGGGSNSDIPAGLPNDSSAGFNSNQGTFGSSVNLRGLGSASTLVLLNGRRLAPSSGIGDFVDISMIPAFAIERVEVLTDGASSVYGADAVAGVVNFVLRDDFEGLEATVRYGTVTDGDLEEYRASVTGGLNWEAGNALFSYEYFKQSNLGVEERDFTQGAPVPNDLLPSQERHSVLASTSHNLTSELDIFGDFTFSRRESEQAATSTNDVVFSSLPSSESLNLSAGGSWQFSNTWFVDFSGTYSDVQNEPEQAGGFVSKRKVDSSLWALDAKISGTLFDLPGGDLKLAIGGQYRDESFTSFRVDTNVTDRDADRDIFALFGELFIPIVGDGSTIPGIERLELNVSARYEKFSDFGSTSDPKVGLLWSPVENLKFRGSFGTSFNPPPLGRVGATDLVASVERMSSINGIFGLTPGDPSIADVVVTTLFGTDKDLNPENSETYTFGLDFTRQWGRHDFSAAVTYFDTDFEDRLGSTPMPGGVIAFDAPNIAFHTPELLPDGTVVFSPSQQEISSILTNLDALFANEDLLDSEIINFAFVVRNLSRTTVSGFDFDVAYALDIDNGTVSLGLDGTYLRNFRQQGAVTTPLVEQVDTLLNPLDLRLRGRVSYTRGGFSANAFVNFADDYAEDRTADAAKIESWTTVDASLSYDTADNYGQDFLNSTVVRLSMLNLFDEDPPSTVGNPTFRLFGYDATNASPLGRFISLELAKRF